MRIYISDEIFQKIPWYEILTVINKAIIQHHEIELDDQGVGYNGWLYSCANDDPDIAGLISFSLVSSIFVGSKRSVKVKITPAADDEVTFKELDDCLLRSFFIYVENARADKKFLYSILTPELIRDLKKQEKIGAVVFENAGGITELAKKVVDDYDSRAKLSLRSFALFDSDALIPGVPSTDANTAKMACVKVKIPFYCLSRRAIENYIPGPALLAYAKAKGGAQLKAQRTKLARAFMRMDLNQQCHFHMKDGLKAPHGGNYAHIDQRDVVTLTQGFGNHLSECFDENGFVDRKLLEDSNAWLELELLATTIMEVL